MTQKLKAIVLGNNKSGFEEFILTKLGKQHKQN